MYIEEFYKGQKFNPPEIFVTEEEILEFAEKYDPLPIHIDPEFAAAGHFGGIIASGYHTLALVWGNWIRQGYYKNGVIGGVAIEFLHWHRPVRPGDTLRTEVTMADLLPSKAPDRGKVVLNLKVYNQDEVFVMEFQTRGYAKKRPQE